MDRVESNRQAIAPILVLGLGNVLLGDDGVGPRLVRELQSLYASEREVECLDGGTQGLALLGYFNRRRSLIILDARADGHKAGEVTVLDRASLCACTAPHSTTAHEGNAAELLASAQLLGELPDRVYLVGIEPERIQTELGLSESVTKSLPFAFVRACEIVEKELAHLQSATA